MLLQLAQEATRSGATITPMGALCILFCGMIVIFAFIRNRKDGN